MAGDEYAVFVLAAREHDSFVAANGVRIWDVELDDDAFRAAARAAAEAGHSRLRPKREAGLTPREQDVCRVIEVRGDGWTARLDEIRAQAGGTHFETASDLVAEYLRVNAASTPLGGLPPRDRALGIERRRAWTATLTTSDGERQFDCVPAEGIDPPSSYVATSLNALAADGWTVHYVAEDRALHGEEVRLVSVRYLLRRAA